MASSTDIRSVAYFPRQAISYNDKIADDGEFMKKCIDAGIALSRNTDNGQRRSPYTRKTRNYNLYNGKFDKTDMDFEIQPISLAGFTFPAKLQYRDIVSPIFNLLIGEESKRGTSFTVLATNPEVTSKREEAKKQAVLDVLSKYMAAENPEDPQKALEEVQKYYTYDYKDIESQTGQHLLNYLYKNLKLDYQFFKGWEDSLIAGEEMYEIAEISNEAVARRLNPLHTFFVITKDSDFIDDAEIIVHDTYMSPGRVIDEYYEELTEEEIDQIENLMDNRLPLDASFSLFPPRDVIRTEEEVSPYISSGYLDGYGNVRVSKVTWRSRKKIGELTYLDETGQSQKTYVDENYKPDKKNKNEVVEWFWINEYWEGTRIKNNIYVKMGPKKQQFRRMDNISACKSGYVGTLYNANNAIAVSLMDRLVPWIYLYITIWYRTELLMAANQGKIALIDISLIPDDWEPEKWMYYASIMKFGFVNSFNEGKKGQAKGKLAQGSTQNKALDLETGNAIQHHIGLLDYIENKVGELAGVTKPRKGEIQASAGVGNTQASVSQSSTITEKWFDIHNNTKQRVLETLLDVAKDVYRENPDRLQYITNDLGIASFETNDGLAETEHGVFVSNATKDIAAIEALKQASQAALQNDKADFYEVAQVFTSGSIGELMPKLKQHSIDKKNAIQKQEQMQQAIEQAKIDLQHSQIEQDSWNKEQDRQTKIRVAEITSTGMEKDTQATLAATKLALEERKLAFQERESERVKAHEDKQLNLHEKELELEKELTHKEIKSKEQMHSKKMEVEKLKAKNKPKPSAK